MIALATPVSAELQVYINIGGAVPMRQTAKARSPAASRRARFLTAFRGGRLAGARKREPFERVGSDLRSWAGLHDRNGDPYQCGGRVCDQSRHVEDLFAVPEPSTWAMMCLGLSGSATRLSAAARRLGRSRSDRRRTSKLKGPPQGDPSFSRLGICEGQELPEIGAPDVGVVNVRPIAGVGFAIGNFEELVEGKLNHPEG